MLDKSVEIDIAITMAIVKSSESLVSMAEMWLFVALFYNPIRTK